MAADQTGCHGTHDGDGSARARPRTTASLPPMTPTEPAGKDAPQKAAVVAAEESVPVDVDIRTDTATDRASDTATDTTDAPLWRAARWCTRRYRWLVFAFGITSFTLTALLLTPGHFWGDDWTLYIRQAEGIVHLRTGDVVRDARFTVDESIGPAFSPRVYPWGTAMLLAVPIAALGRNIAALKLTMAFSMSVVTMTFFSLTRRRASAAAAVAAASCIALSLPMLRWADVIGSDIPYVAAVGICLAVFARWHMEGGFDRRRFVVLGALGAMAFSFRQEGLTVLAALLAGAAWSRLWYSRKLATLKKTALDLTLAAAAFLGITALLAFLLPYEILPSYEGSGPNRIRPSIIPYLRGMGDQYGLFSGTTDRIEALDRPWLGWTLIVVCTLFFAIGLARMLTRHDALDVTVVLALLFHVYSATTALHSNSRYLYTAVALITVVGAQGIATLAAVISRVSGAAPWGVTLLLALPLVWIQVPRYQDAAESAGDSRARNDPWNGPFEDRAAEMIAAVDELTGADDVVGFRKARAITLFTDRSAVQTPWPSAVPPIADWYVSEKAKDGTFPTPPESRCECTATAVWSNSRYTLYRLDPIA